MVGVLCFTSMKIPCKTVNVESLPDDCEVILIELSIKSRKWLSIGLYKPLSQNEKYTLEHLSFTLTKISREYENFMLIGDLNFTVEKKNFEVFMNTFDLECLTKKPACFQSTSPSCIDLILTNKKEFFKNSDVLEVGISDHHSLIVTALRSQLVKGNAKTKLYRDYNSFDLKLFKEDLDKNLKSNNTVNFSDFQNTFTTVLHKHAPIKKKILRFNNSPFMSKALRKAIMHRSKLKNVYNKKRTDVNWANYKKQRNFCVTLLRRTKKEYFQNLNVKNLLDNKKFWKIIKPYFSNKGLNSNKMLLKEKGELISDEKQLASIMNKFFINITRSLKLKKIRVALPLL